MEAHVGMSGAFTPQTLAFSLDMLSCAWLDKLFKTKMFMNHLQTELQENIFILCQLLRNLLKLMLSEVGRYNWIILHSKYFVVKIFSYSGPGP